jgi:hypothetical protein
MTNPLFMLRRLARLAQPALAAGLTLTLLCGSLVAGEDQGQVERAPWSGYWWPHREGRLIGPLAKYDELAGKAAAASVQRTTRICLPTSCGNC